MAVGRPDPRNGLLTNDTPFQIHDLDGDGKNEVVLVRDFQLRSSTAQPERSRRRAWMPKTPADNKERPYEINNGDSIAVLRPLAAASAPQEILIKDRYRTSGCSTTISQLLWSPQGQTGHYPFPVDIDGDGATSS